jgi:hypothetical protein
MDLSKGLTLKRPITVKAIVTPRWKQEVQQQLQRQITQLDGQITQLESQGQNAIAQIQQQSIVPAPPQVVQQIENIKGQVGQKKAEILQRKNQASQQLQQAQVVELGQEVIQAQMDSFFQVQQGDNLIQKMNVEIVLRDGVIEEIRGEI